MSAKALLREFRRAEGAAWKEVHRHAGAHGCDAIECDLHSHLLKAAIEAYSMVRGLGWLVEDVPLPESWGCEVRS